MNHKLESRLLEEITNLRHADDTTLTRIRKNACVTGVEDAKQLKFV